MSVIDEIVEERKRQVGVEGYEPEHDDEHKMGEIAAAAAAYAAASSEVLEASSEALWPFTSDFKPKDSRRNLIRAAALIVAEISRIDRLAEQQKEKP